MTLREWMTHNHVTQRDMAKRLGTSQQNILRWVAEVTPSLEMIKLIKEVTGGAVDYEDFILENKHKGDVRLYNAGLVDRAVVDRWKIKPDD